MLTYPMEDRGGLPLYEYLYRRIREDILSGVLPAGTRLPSKRALAEHLRVSVMTVETAYAQLTAEGYLESRPRLGYFAAQVDHSPAAPAAPAALPEPEPEKVWKLDLKANRIDASRFPFSLWAKLTRQVLSERGAALLAPMPNAGLPDLRQAIADDLRDYRGMTVSPEQVVIGSGAAYLYLLLAQLIGRETVLALEDPGYPKVGQVYRSSGLQCVPVPLDRQGIRLDLLRRSGATAAHISPSHHYPTGLTMPIQRRQALLRWAEEADGLIIEDDYDSEFRFTGRPIPPLQSIDRQGRVIYMNTFSQTIAPSMRIGFLVLPPRLLDRWQAAAGFYSCTVPALEQAVLARFMSSGHYEQHLSRMRIEYRARRAAVLEAFRTSPFAHRITITENGAGLHFLLKLDTCRSGGELRARGVELGIRAGFLSEYAVVPTPEMDRTLVVNYASLDPRQLDGAMDLLAEWFAEM